MFYFDSSQNICESTYVTVDVFCHCKVEGFGLEATVVERNTGEMKHVCKCTVTESDFENK